MPKGWPRVAASPGMLVTGWVVLFSVGAVDAQTPTPRTRWGDPDLRGLWHYGTATPLERPDRFGGRERLTPAEIAAVNAEAQSTDGVGARRVVWWERGLSDGRSSLIVDPADGRLPYTALARVNRVTGERRSDRPEDRNPNERCLSAGVPRLGGPFSQNIHLVQTPRVVLLLYEMIHEFRVVPLDDRPHVAGGVRQWLGDSRGWWEGDTLMIETTNFRGDQLFRGLSMATTRLVERLTPLEVDILRYEVTFSDPSHWTRPWTARIDMPRTPGPMFEYACHEGNDGMTSMLEIARGEDGNRTRP